MLTTSQSYVIYPGNGATTVFPFNFIILQASHLVVYIQNTAVQGSSPITLSPTQYSVTGIGNINGGTVIYPASGSPLAAGWTITIQRIVPYQQPTSLSNQGAFYPQVVEESLDLLTMQNQQLAAQIAGETAVIYPVGINWRGTWDPTIYYNEGDGVTFASQLYVAMSANINNEPDQYRTVWTTISAGPVGPQGATGPTGAQGPQGPQGATGPQGLSGVNWRGNWSSTVTYNQGDGVTSNGNLYVAILNNEPPGNQPPNGTYWQLFTGSQGPQGPQGSQGPQGIQGPQGPTGATGAQGPQGPAGPAPFQNGVIGGNIGNGSVYQNTSTLAMFVCVWAFGMANKVTTLNAYVGSTNPPGWMANFAQTGSAYNGANTTIGISFVVPAGCFWCVNASNISSGIGVSALQ